MAPPGCSDEVVVFEEEVRSPHFAAIEKTMQEMWDQMTRQPAPDTFYVDPATGEWLRLESERLQRLREVTSPLGLKRMFPGLR